MRMPHEDLQVEIPKAVLTKSALIQEVAGSLAIPQKDALILVQTIFDSMVRALRAGDKVEIRGFGNFRLRQRRARIGRNPKTGAQVQVPAKKIPYFKLSKELKAAMERL